MTDPDCSRLLGKPKGNGDMEIPNMGMRLLLGNCGRIGNAPSGVASAEVLGADHATSTHEVESGAAITLPSLTGLTDTERRETLIVHLYRAGQQYKAARTSRIELIQAARANKVSCHEIGVALGITENAVRGLINRAKKPGAPNDNRR